MPSDKVWGKACAIKWQVVRQKSLNVDSKDNEWEQAAKEEDKGDVKIAFKICNIHKAVKAVDRKEKLSTSS